MPETLEVDRPLVAPDPVLVKRPKVKPNPASKEELDAAFPEFVPAHVASGEPKPQPKDCKAALVEGVGSVLFADLPGGKASIVIVTETGRSHTWGPRAAIVASAQRAGLDVT